MGDGMGKPYGFAIQGVYGPKIVRCMRYKSIITPFWTAMAMNIYELHTWVLRDLVRCAYILAIAPVGVL